MIVHVTHFLLLAGMAVSAHEIQSMGLRLRIDARITVAAMFLFSAYDRHGEYLSALPIALTYVTWKIYAWKRFRDFEAREIEQFLSECLSVNPSHGLVRDQIPPSTI